MHGCPKTIATKQDFINLLLVEEYRDPVLAELKKIAEANDSTATQATTLIDPGNPEAGYNVVEIDNPMPLWKVKGFSSREEVRALYEEYGGSE